MSTETELRAWREGQIKAERLCAGILSISGFTDIDPQAPLGGPDGKKDILARKDGHLFVAAVFFPPTDQSFTKIEKKFIEDRAGVAKHGANGFVFFVNEPLTLGQRKTLLGHGGSLDEVYALERMRHILDSPPGYGLRLEYLHKEMSVEEQIAYFHALRKEIERPQLEDHQRLEEKVDTMIAQTKSALALVSAISDPSSIKRGRITSDLDASMLDLSVGQIQLLHRAITEESSLPDEVRGVIRTMRVWIESSADPTYDPPPPEEVVPRLEELLTWWRETYPSLNEAELTETVEAIARMHHGIVAIHPFLDGNGRLARFIADQAAHELLNQSVGKDLVSDHEQYFSALRAADGGDLNPLAQLLRAALT